MITIDEEIEVFLEHHGVKGMRWGVRTTKQRIGIGAAAVVAGFIGSRLTKHSRLPIKIIGTSASALAGAGAVSKLLNRHANKKLHKLKNKTTDAELFRRAQPALKEAV